MSNKDDKRQSKIELIRRIFEFCRSGVAPIYVQDLKSIAAYWTDEMTNLKLLGDQTFIWHDRTTNPKITLTEDNICEWPFYIIGDKEELDSWREAFKQWNKEIEGND